MKEIRDKIPVTEKVTVPAEGIELMLFHACTVSKKDLESKFSVRMYCGRWNDVYINVPGRHRDVKSTLPEILKLKQSIVSQDYMTPSDAKKKVIGYMGSTVRGTEESRHVRIKVISSIA